MRKHVKLNELLTEKMFDLQKG